jgi:hypothetical protein
MPCASQMLPSEPVTDPQEVELVLPSALTPGLRSTIPKIAEIERKLRVAQADDALADIRRQRRLITGLYTFKKLNLSGQGNRPNTRIRAIFNRMTTKTDRLAERYRAAHSALGALDPDPAASWRLRLRSLEAKDVRGPGREIGESQGRHVESWIWLVPAVSSDAVGDQDFNSSLRVEWARSRARRDRWCEEYLILQEEMRRVVAYLAWKANWWDSRCDLRVPSSGSEKSVLHGVAAYARKQASLQRRLAAACISHWSPSLMTMGIAIDWADIGNVYKPEGQDEVDNPTTLGGSLKGKETGFDSDSDDDEGDPALELDSCIFEA